MGKRAALPASSAPLFGSVSATISPKSGLTSHGVQREDTENTRPGSPAGMERSTARAPRPASMSPATVTAEGAAAPGSGSRLRSAWSGSAHFAAAQLACVARGQTATAPGICQEMTIHHAPSGGRALLTDAAHRLRLVQ